LLRDERNLTSLSGGKPARQIQRAKLSAPNSAAKSAAKSAEKLGWRNLARQTQRQTLAH
jgi:hypothetical protein